MIIAEEFATEGQIVVGGWDISNIKNCCRNIIVNI